MSAVAGATCQRSGGFFHLVHVRHLLDVVLFYVLSHGVHDPGHFLLRLLIIVELQARAAVGADVVWIRGVAVIAVCAECACPSFHDFVNLFSGEVLGKHFEVGWSRVVARRLTCTSRWRALRCLGDGRDREDCTGDDGDRDCGRGQGSEFQRFPRIVK
jgi:hypothetical protein